MRDRAILKGHKKPYKYHIFLFLTILISVVSINGATIFYEAFIDMKYGDSKYGTYHGALFNMDTEKINRFSKEIAVDRVVPFERIEYFSYDGEHLYIDAVPQDYFDFTEFTLTSGSFPTNRSELCCESSFLFRLGIPREDYIGSKITLQDKEYTVTGTFAAQRLWSTMPRNDIHCFTAEPERINAAAFSFKSVTLGDFVMRKYEKNKVYCEYNMNRWSINWNVFDMRELYIPILAVLLAVVTAVLIRASSAMFMYHNAGKGVFLGVFRTSAAAWIAGILCSFPAAAAVRGIFEYAYSFDISAFLFKKGIFVTLILSLGLLLLYAAISLAVIFFKTRRKNIRTVKREAPVMAEKRVSAEKLPWFFIVKGVITSAPLLNLFTLAAFCVLICLIPIFRNYFSSSVQDVERYKGYDYVAEIKENRAPVYDIEDYIQYISEPDIEGCTAVPVYVRECEFTVYKDTISDEYVELLKNDYPYELNDRYSDTMKLPFILVGVTPEKQKQLGVELEYGEAIAYRSLVNRNGSVTGVKLENHQELQFNIRKSLEIVGVKDDYDGLMPLSQIANVLMVDVDTYEAYSGESFLIPSHIYYKVSDEERAEFKSAFDGRDFIRLKDIGLIQGNNKYLKACWKLDLFLIMLTLLILLINSGSAAYTYVRRVKMEYAAMQKPQQMTEEEK